MKLGLDLHKTIDANPSMFVTIAEHLLEYHDNEVHIVTGIQFTKAVEEELLKYGRGEKWWTHFFSITQHLLDSGQDYTVEGSGDDAHYHFDDTAWNKVKAEYCAKHKIDLHIDDSPEYLQYFTTPYMLYNFDPTREIKRRKDKYKLELNG